MQLLSGLASLLYVALMAVLVMVVYRLPAQEWLARILPAPHLDRRHSFSLREIVF